MEVGCSSAGLLGAHLRSLATRPVGVLRYMYSKILDTEARVCFNGVMAKHNESSTVYRHDEGDEWVDGRTTVVIDGWNFSTQTSSADTLLKVSCFRADNNTPVDEWERHPVLDGREIDLGEASARYNNRPHHDRIVNNLQREAYELGVLGQYVHYSRYRDGQYISGPTNPNYTQEVAR